MAPADFVDLAVRHAPAESDDVMLAFVLARAQTAFTRYLSDAQAAALAPRLEGFLRERMLNAATPGQRITYFRTYREVATSPAALDDLKRSEEHTSELQSRQYLVCRLLLEKKKKLR